jgi:hypothetical protein
MGVHGADTVEMCGDVDWIKLAQSTDQWRALLDTAMKFKLP